MSAAAINLSELTSNFDVLLGRGRGKRPGEAEAGRWHPYGLRAPLLMRLLEAGRGLTGPQLRAYVYVQEDPASANEAGRRAHLALGEDRRTCLRAVYADIAALTAPAARFERDLYAGCAIALNRAALALLTADRTDIYTFRLLAWDAGQLLGCDLENWR